MMGSTGGVGNGGVGWGGGGAAVYLPLSHIVQQCDALIDVMLCMHATLAHVCLPCGPCRPTSPLWLAPCPLTH
jgi:hypothetical protein